LLNYWNNNQVFNISGPAYKEQFDVFLSTLKAVNPRAKVYKSNSGNDSKNFDELGI
jgi:hypothetical protein